MNITGSQQDYCVSINVWLIYKISDILYGSYFGSPKLHLAMSMVQFFVHEKKQIFIRICFIHIFIYIQLYIIRCEI